MTDPAAIAAARRGSLAALAWIVVSACHASGIDPAAVSQAVGESARHTGPDEPLVVFGWHLEVAGDRARWRGCTSATACAFQERETEVKNVVSVDRVGETTVAAPDGPRAVDVQKITLRPGSQVKP